MIVLVSRDTIESLFVLAVVQGQDSIGSEVGLYLAKEFFAPRLHYLLLAQERLQVGDGRPVLDHYQIHPKCHEKEELEEVYESGWETHSQVQAEDCA